MHVPQIHVIYVTNISETRHVIIENASLYVTSEAGGRHSTRQRTTTSKRGLFEGHRKSRICYS